MKNLNSKRNDEVILSSKGGDNNARIKDENKVREVRNSTSEMEKEIKIVENNTNNIENLENFDKIEKGNNTSFFESVKHEISKFTADPLNTYKSSIESLTTPFINLYNILSVPDYDKVQYGDYYSELIHIKILPLLKTSLFILAILITCTIIFYIAFKFAQLTFKLIFKQKKEENYNSQNKSKSNISLKGRVKRSPDNINYNELFTEPKIINQKKKKNQSNLNNDNQEKKNQTKNLDEFIQRVKEKDDFEKMFSEQVKSSEVKISEISEKNSLKENENLLVFDNEKEFIFVDDYKNKSEPTILKVEQIKISEKIEKIEKIENFKNEDNDDSFAKMEDKMKNSDLYFQTPLANLRRNTNNSKK